MNPFLPVAAYLDKKAFLSCRLWQFSLQNIFRDFPWFCFFQVLLRFPLQTARGLLLYRLLVKRSGGSPLSGTMDFTALTAHADRFLIAPGFCMKPYDAKKNRSTCPAGHFNHECRLLDDIELLHQKEKWPKPCRQCGIAPLALKAVELQADFYLMTSALDIAKDVYIPALQNRGARYGLFVLCPYSLEPFTFGMAIAGIKGALVPFCRGDCRNHAEWTRADHGMKNEQTFLADDAWRHVFVFFELLKRHRRFPEKCQFVFEEHIYRARFDERISA